MKVLETIERLVRRGIVYPVLRSMFRNPVSDRPIDLAGVKQILVFRFDRIGDMIVTLPVLRAMKERTPETRLAVLASRDNAELVRNCRFVDEVYTLETNRFTLLAQVLDLRRRQFDVVLNFVFNQTTTPAILANVIAPNGMKIGQGPDKYAFYFNRLVRVPRFKRHMTEQVAIFVEETFGIRLSEHELDHVIEVPEVQQNSVDGWLRHNSLKRRSDSGSDSSPYVVLNLSARDRERGLSVEQAAGIASLLSKSAAYRTVVVFAPQDERLVRMITTRPEFGSCHVFRTEGSAPLLQLASLVGGAVAVVTPDTSVIHFASAMQTPVVGIYGEEYKEVEWGPFRVRHKIIRSKGERPVSAIGTAELVREIDSFLEAVLREQGSTKP